MAAGKGRQTVADRYFVPLANAAERVLDSLSSLRDHRRRGPSKSEAADGLGGATMRTRRTAWYGRELIRAMRDLRRIADEIPPEAICCSEKRGYRVSEVLYHVRALTTWADDIGWPVDELLDNVDFRIVSHPLLKLLVSRQSLLYCGKIYLFPRGLRDALGALREVLPGKEAGEAEPLAAMRKDLKIPRTSFARYVRILKGQGLKLTAKNILALQEAGRKDRATPLRKKRRQATDHRQRKRE
jgi:hypothetical protein